MFNRSDGSGLHIFRLRGVAEVAHRSRVCAVLFDVDESSYEAEAAEDGRASANYDLRDRPT